MPTGIGTTAQLSTTSGISSVADYAKSALGLSTSTASKKSQKIEIGRAHV